MAESDTRRIVIAGGGVAGLEACLALRSFPGEGDLSIDLLCREHVFEYRPLAVLAPFDGAPVWSMELERFAADQDVHTSSRSSPRPACASGACGRGS